MANWNFHNYRLAKQPDHPLIRKHDTAQTIENLAIDFAAYNQVSNVSVFNPSPEEDLSLLYK